MACQRASTVRVAAVRSSVFELGEDLLDRVEVGAVGRQVEEAGAAGFDRFAHAGDLVGRKVVHDDDVARLERRRQGLLDIGKKALAVDGAVEDAGRGDPVVAQRGQEGGGLPVAVRHGSPRPAAAPLAAAVAPGHVGLGPGLVDEDQAFGLNAGCPCRQAARAVATSGRSCSAACWGFFFASGPSQALRNRLIAAGLA